MDSAPNELMWTRLSELTASGDPLDLAIQMRELGVESLLFCRPEGRIEQVVTDRQIAALATRNGPADVIPAQNRQPLELPAPADFPAPADQTSVVAPTVGLRAPGSSRTARVIRR